jgi:hypothetical protein
VKFQQQVSEIGVVRKYKIKEYKLLSFFHSECLEVIKPNIRMIIEGEYMNRILIAPFLLFTLLCFSGETHTGIDKHIKQVGAILRFRDAVTGTKVPNLETSYGIFGEDNEIELELFLSQEFPKLSASAPVPKDSPAVKEFNNYDKNRNNPSRFFICIRKIKAKTFSSVANWYIKVPSKTTEYFTRYDVLVEKEPLVFEFSEDNSEIENIYFPNGKSIYKLSSLCKAK